MKPIKNKTLRQIVFNFIQDNKFQVFNVFDISKLKQQIIQLLQEIKMQIQNGLPLEVICKLYNIEITDQELTMEEINKQIQQLQKIQLTTKHSTENFISKYI